MSNRILSFVQGSHWAGLLGENSSTAFGAGLLERGDPILNHIQELKARLEQAYYAIVRKDLTDAIASNQKALSPFKQQIYDNLHTLDIDDKLTAAGRSASIDSPLDAAGEILTGNYKGPLDFSH